MSFPLVNATLTKVAAQASEDYDTPAGPDIDVWTGSEKAYVSEELVEVPRPDRIDVLRKTTIVIPADVGRLVQAQHLLAYTYDGAAHTRLVQSVSVVAALGRARVALEDG